MTVELITKSSLDSYRETLISLFRSIDKEEAAERLFELGLEHEDEIARDQYFKTLIADLHNRINGSKRSVLDLGYRFDIVDPGTFLTDSYFLDLEDEVYPAVLPEFIELNSGKYVEAILTGGIGSAKTTVAIWTQAYQLFLLSCYKNPHAVFGLERSSEIELIFQSKTLELADSLDYERFKTLIMRSPYFRKHFMWEKSIESELHFPNRIIVKPVSGSNMATIGQNVIGGMIDEINYMAVVEKSKRATDGGVYDQAVALYNSISRRRKSRFYSQGKLPGILCLVSSKKFPGQFTDLKMDEAKKDKTIFVYDKRMWDIKPDNFSSKKFKVFIGDHYRKPRIVPEYDTIPNLDRSLITEVPEDFRSDFERDIVDSLREIAGVSHLSKHPFFNNPEPLVKMFKPEVRPIFNMESVNFDDKQLELFKKALRRLNPKYPRYAHIDLGLTGDAAGLCIAHVSKFVQVDRGERLYETMPYISIDGALEITPPRGGEIMFFKIRRILYLLMSLGMQIRWASLDSFQSADSLQILMQKGLSVGNLSMDTSMLPYDMLKSAVLDFRIECAENELVFDQLRNLQVDFKAQKVDHLPQKAKDVSDAVAGCVYGLTTRREIWHMHEIPISESIVGAISKSEKKMKVAKEVANTEEPMARMERFYGSREG